MTTILTPTFIMVPDTHHWLRNLAFADPLHGWVMRGAFVPKGGAPHFVAQQFLATSDGGTTWFDLPLPGFAVSRLIFASPQQGWAVTPTGIQETQDGGYSWFPGAASRLPPDLTWRDQPGASTPCDEELEYPDHFSFIDARTGWVLCVGQPGAGHQHKQLFHSLDGGRTWNLIADSSTSTTTTQLASFGYGSDLQFIDTHHAWMQVGRVGMLVTTDGGQTWHSSPPIVRDDPQVTAIAPVSPTHGFALVRGDTLIATTDGAQTWRQVYPHPIPLARQP
jgi:photosystem II stability/assembly factor-like uncharacterized protein